LPIFPAWAQSQHWLALAKPMFSGTADYWTNAAQN
jgi:hypothetical protein